MEETQRQLRLKDKFVTVCRSVPATHEDTMRLVNQVPGRMGLLMRLLYGCAMRIHDGLRIRLQDLDFTNEEILIRTSKCDKDRIVPMPMALKEELQALVAQREVEHLADKQSNHSWVWLPGLLGKKYPKAHLESAWQYLFPSPKLSRDPQSGNIGRHHLTPESIQNALRKARQELKIKQRFTPRSLRLASALQMQRNGVPEQVISKMIGLYRTDVVMRQLNESIIIPKRISPLDNG